MNPFLWRSLFAFACLFSIIAGETAEIQATQLRYLSYDAIVKRMHRLAEIAPDYVEVWNAQERYGVASPGNCRAADANGELTALTPCKHWFMTITNRSNGVDCKARVSGSDCIADRPQMFLSGNLHGDEVIGPLTLLLFAEDLILLHLVNNNPWATLMLNTRYIVVIPVTNPLGFDQGVREENHIDPNRDFPYAQDPAHCMQTTVARAINEVWRGHLFRGGITFHGGMQAIAYEWGSPNHMAHNSESPDDVAQRTIGGVMRDAAGAFNNHAYPVDRMNKLVYPVRGGMEDWAYAASWDTGAVQPCQPSTYQGYDARKTVYNDAVLRAFLILVETADDKRPAENTLGMHPPIAEAYTPGGNMRFSLADVFASAGTGDGHIPRNVRLTAAYLDLLDPYLVLTDRAASVVVQPLGTRRLRGGTQAALQAPLPSLTGGDRPTLHFEKDSSAGGSHLIRRLGVAAGYAGPRQCFAGALCNAWAQQFDYWHHFEVEGGHSLVNGESVELEDMSIKLQLAWDVGGSVSVAQTGLLIGTWDPRVPPSLLEQVQTIASLPSRLSAFGLTEYEAQRFAEYVLAWQDMLSGKVKPENMEEKYVAHRGPVQQGRTGWSQNARQLSEAHIRNVASDTYMGRFSDCVRLPTGGLSAISQCTGTRRRLLESVGAQNATTAFVVVLFAVPDAEWGTQTSPDPASTRPQSHMVNARMNPAWSHENNGFHVQGRASVVSRPVFIGIRAEVLSAGANQDSENQVDCDEVDVLSRQYPIVNSFVEVSTVSVGPFRIGSNSVVVYAAVASGALIAVITAIGFRSARRRNTHIPLQDIPDETNAVPAATEDVGGVTQTEGTNP